MSAEMIEQAVETVENDDISETVTECGEIVEEEEEPCFQDIDVLLQHGFMEEDVKKLKNAGINTIKGVQMTMTKKFHEVLNFDVEKITKLKDICSKITLANIFVTAAEVCFQRKQIFKLTTGSKALDKLLGGGIEAMAITEVFGEFRTGKTQLSHTLCVTAQLPGNGGYMGGKVIFIDTEHTFRPERLRAIADRFSLNQTAVMENILYTRAYNSEHQFELLKSVAAKLHEEAGVFKLLIIDSIMALFRVDYSGRGEIFSRQQKLAQMMSKLQKISEEYNIAVFITNQMAADFREPNLVTRPIGGHILAHASTIRVSLSKAEGASRKAKLLDSPDMKEAEVGFLISEGGIDDIIVN